jgi:hypothetical protein
MLRWRSLVYVLFSMLLISSAALAQRDLGSLTGTVTDPQGAAVPNAQVTITEGATGLTYQVTTDQSGTYGRPALKPGVYSVECTATGFQKAVQNNVNIDPSARVAVNLTLQVGAASQTIEVTSAAPLLQTENVASGATINPTVATSLPLGGQRQLNFLARLSPGVVPAEPGARDAGGGGFSANGVRSNGQNNYLLNGVDNNVNVIDFLNQNSSVINPSVEAVGAVQILTTGTNAEYGRGAGGVLDLNLKSGTNQFHGVIFEVLQNEKFNANSWENNWAGKSRNAAKQNQFGGTLGGPIIKDKLFFFADYQGTRLATAGGTVLNLGYGGTRTIPTPAQVHGDFSALLGPQIGTDALGRPILQNQIYDPATTRTVNGQLVRDPFPGNIIPSNRFDPAAAKLLSMFPAPNLPYAAGNYPQNDYFVSTPGALNTDQGDARIDYRLSEKDSLFGSLSWSNTLKTSAPPFAGALDGETFNGTGETDLGRNAQIGYTRTWTPALLTETRIGFSRLVTSRTLANTGSDVYKALGIGGFDPTANTGGGLMQISASRYTQFGGNDWLPTTEYSNVWDFIQNVAVTTGNHSLKFGFEFRPISFPFYQFPYPNGEIGINQNETAAPLTTKDVGGRNGTFNADTGDEIASFLLGSLNYGQISTTNFISTKKLGMAWYAQDDWKLTQKLTLNLGLRYELFSPINERFGRQSNFNYDTQTLVIPEGPNQNTPLPNGFTTQFPQVKVSRGETSGYMIPWDKTNIGPRIGLAYNVRPKTVVRLSYGIYYGGEENQGGNPQRAESAPFNYSPTLTRPGSVGTFQPNPYFNNGAATGQFSAGFPTNVFSIPAQLQLREIYPDFRNSMVQKWTVAVQQELPGQMALTASYDGNHQSHQLLQPDPNSCPNLGTTNSSITCNTIRPFPNLGNIQGTASFGFGNYDAGTLQLQKRMSSGLQLMGAYTYGHALANSGTTLSGSTGFAYKDPRNISASYSNAAWDIRHNFTMAFNYEVPFGKGKAYGSHLNPIIQTIIGNWQANGIASFRTGSPFTVRSNGCLGVWNACQPDLKAGADPNAAPANGRNPNQWFDTSNFLAPAPLTGGNLGLQTNYGPPTRTVDFSLFKDFVFTERFRLQFRTEATNLGNTPQFSTPDNNRQDTNFGRITTTQSGAERHIQFQLRLSF